MICTFIFTCVILQDTSSENPTPKFGEALRAQVEERLAFFESGVPPSKNADAIRKVLDQLALDDDADDDMDVDGPAITTLEAEPRKEKKKKRKSEAMDVDEEDEPETKKVKLSKEEKKALKKAKKEEAKAAAAVEDAVRVLPNCTKF